MGIRTREKPPHHDEPRDCIRVLLADNHPAVRAAIASLLSTTEDIEVVGEAADGRAAVAEALRLKPDIVVMDIRMPEMDGLAATQRIRELRLEAEVIGFSGHHEPWLVRRMMNAGASAFLPKNGPPEDVLTTIRRMHQRARRRSAG